MHFPPFFPIFSSDFSPIFNPTLIYAKPETMVPIVEAPATVQLPRHPSQTELDELCINTIRCLSMDAVQAAKSGHPGMPMGMAAVGYRLWTKYLRHDPSNPTWPNRDRFVLSNGHGCMLLYSLLHLTGYDLSLDEIRKFRQLGSRTPGHPEYAHTAGVEATTGPLGQGISNAVGMAIAGKYLQSLYGEDPSLFDYKVYVFAGDGCLQEGVSSETSSLAGHLGLNNLIVVYDDNSITIDGPTGLSFGENVRKRYEAYGWRTEVVEGDGNDLQGIDRALDAALEETERPTLICLKTHIGFGSPNKQDSHEAHGSPLGDEEIALTKQRYGWDPQKKFFIPPEALDLFRKEKEKGARAEAEWNSRYQRYVQANPEKGKDLARGLKGEPAENWEARWKDVEGLFQSGTQLATRQAQGKILDMIMPALPRVIGGSADLTPSNNTRFKGAEDFSRGNRKGRYIRYGVREHGMAAIMNGIALSRLLIPYGGTFFTFSDYMRPSLRLAALSGYPTIFVFTHDSIGLGEDGPTHQAVEHLSALRAMPGMVMLRPADATETVFAWKFALENRSGPTAIALTRQAIPVLDRKTLPPASGLLKGAYALSKSPKADILLLATGSEVHLALAASETLAKDGIKAGVVSMPSWELFERQSAEYRESVLPRSIRKRVAVEAGVRHGWDRYIGDGGEFVGMSTFGASAPAEDAYRHFGITVDGILRAVRKVMS
jgi:transketolase